MNTKITQWSTRRRTGFQRDVGRPAVVDGARDEERVQADAVDRGDDPWRAGGRERDQQAGGGEREPDRVLVEASAEGRELVAHGRRR